MEQLQEHFYSSPYPVPFSDSQFCTSVLLHKNVVLQKSKEKKVRKNKITKTTLTDLHIHINDM